MAQDFHSPIDLRSKHDALEWASTANIKRPWRNDFFLSFINEVAKSDIAGSRILELGSGPGFLAEALLKYFNSINYVSLDFSGAMHVLARERLGLLANRVQFLELNFLDSNWLDEIGQFDSVVTHQAVHELRHKNRAVKLHEQVRKILNKGGIYLVCDHYFGEDGMSNHELYMTVEEQQDALYAAGFETVELIKQHKDLALHRAKWH